MQTLILDQLKDELAARMDGYQSPFVSPLQTNSYIAMSALQKAIRRGESDLALRSAQTLLKASPSALWRRIGIIAHEDIGIANIPLVGYVTVCLGAKRYRDRLGGDWTVASYLIEQMCKSIKERSTDDLLVQLIHDPALDKDRQHMADLSLRDRLALLSNTECLARTALVAWFSFGSDRLRGAGIPEVNGDPTALFDTLLEMGICPTVVEIARLGVRKTNEILPIFLPLLWQASRDAPHMVQPDILPPVAQIGDIPSYVLDSHTRDGNRCFREFVHRSDEMRAHLKLCNAPSDQWSRIVGRLTFRVESGLVSNRLVWKTGEKLLASANILGRGLTVECIPEGLELMRSQVPLLNAVREDVLRGASQ